MTHREIELTLKEHRRQIRILVNRAAARCMGLATPEELHAIAMESAWRAIVRYDQERGRTMTSWIWLSVSYDLKDQIRELTGRRWDRTILRPDMRNIADYEHLPAPGRTESSAEDSSTLRYVEQYVWNLPPAMQTVLRLRYGLDDGRPRTLSEVGRIIGKSKARVHELEATALRAMRTLMRKDAA